METQSSLIDPSRRPRSRIYFTRYRPWAPYASESLRASAADLTAGPTDNLSRHELAGLIRRFLASEIKAFQFDEELDRFHESSDPIIRHVVHSVWHYYDDCVDHLVCLDKPQWDYLQRLLLMLDANCCIETECKRQWSPKQLVVLLRCAVSSCSQCSAVGVTTCSCCRYRLVRFDRAVEMGADG